MTATNNEKLKRERERENKFLWNHVYVTFLITTQNMDDDDGDDEGKKIQNSKKNEKFIFNKIQLIKAVGHHHHHHLLLSCDRIILSKTDCRILYSSR